MKSGVARSVVATAALVSLALTSTSPPTMASTHDGKPKVLLHVRPVTTKNVCQAAYLGSCQEAVTQGSINEFYDVYLLVARGTQPGLAGVQLGIDYQGGFKFEGGERPIDIFSFGLCAQLGFQTPTPPWPSPGGGIMMVWGDYGDGGCVMDDVNVGGYFYMAAYEPAFLRVIPRPVDQVLKVSNCSSVEITLNELADAGYAWFSDTGLTGCNPCNEPCMGVAVEPTTWSRIKAQVVGGR
ncbi:MAG: hypothetical protein FD129_659 [bacterium]|nr:MAG: hypothetical protein FD129_659 [bacterium]